MLILWTRKLPDLWLPNASMRRFENSWRNCFASGPQGPRVSKPVGSQPTHLKPHSGATDRSKTSDTVMTSADIDKNSDKINKSNHRNQKTNSPNEDVKRYTVLSAKEIGTDYTYKHEIVWKNVIGWLILHFFGLLGLGVILTGGVCVKTVLWTILVGYISVEGVTIGAHRYYTHKSFKAKPLLRAILVLTQTIAGQNSMFIWARDHRLHHRYSDTDADPHNSKRGFFFCHIGWLMAKKHPYVIELGRRIDMSDMKADWMVMYQKKNLQPVESWFVSFISLGEGWHNYHHAFPWDYSASEINMHFNLSADFIRFFEKIGLAYDLKTASSTMVENRILRKGDGTHYALGNAEAKSDVTAIGPLHPLNPTYNVKYEAPSAILKEAGLPLYHEKDIFDASQTSRGDERSAG